MREVAESESDVGKVMMEPKDRERPGDATGRASSQGLWGLWSLGKARNRVLPQSF